MHEPIDHRAALAELQEAFLTSIDEVDPATRVPWCGRWRVRHLVEHLARIHHWAAGQARRRQETPLGRGPFDLGELYARCAAELRETLDALDADAPAWTLLDDGVPRAERHGTVRFWHRRQALETLIHLWDLRTAGGLSMTASDALWLDAVDEVATVMHPRQLRLGRVPPPDARVRLRAHDAVVELTGAAADAPVVDVTGSPRALALLVWGRPHEAPDDLVVDGDRRLLDAVLAAGLTP